MLQLNSWSLSYPSLWLMQPSPILCLIIKYSLGKDAVIKEESLSLYVEEQTLFQNPRKFLALSWWVWLVNFALTCIFVAFQELGELQEAKQLLIQQKLELQTRVEKAQDDLEQERREHQATKDSILQRKEQFLAQIKDMQDKLVGFLCLKPSNGYFGRNNKRFNAAFNSWLRRKAERSRWSVARRQKPSWTCRWRP